MNLYVVGFSGGLDSTTVLYHILKNKKEEDKVIAVNFFYNQINHVEQAAAKRIASKVGVPLITSKIALDYSQLDVTKVNNELKFYMPFRNMIMVSILASIGEYHAKANNIKKVFVTMGLHSHTTYNEYWDITPDFVKSVQLVLDLNNSDIIFKFYAPFIGKTKQDICQAAQNLHVPIKETWTCYNPIKEGNTYKACLECEACKERINYCGRELSETQISLEE